ncbi:Inner membrane protein ygbE [Serratia marcescens]|uniref:Inner membrane protein ygbE n=1 Tax=Serratia marcescens TaxID=615 RepID=A0A379Y291_SERMA|nr:Inner membrane protein ygbE [Serratia marcescens]
MQNVTPILIDSKQSKQEREEPSYSFLGGVSGFVFYWLAFALPFLVYGSNTLFFLLYTWPFFLALMPLSVLIGITLQHAAARPSDLDAAADRRRCAVPVLAGVQLPDRVVREWAPMPAPAGLQAVPKVTKLCLETPECADWTGD